MVACRDRRTTVIDSGVNRGYLDLARSPAREETKRERNKLPTIEFPGVPGCKSGFGCFNRD